MIDTPITVLRVKSDDIVFRPLSMTRRWCSIPYPGHSKGCPKDKKCDLYIDNLKEKINSLSVVHLILVNFDIDKYEEIMAEKHPTWTKKQCRNLLYWQNSLRKRLRDEAKRRFPGKELVIGAEGGGVDFYLTMRKLGMPLDDMKDLHTVRVIGIVLGDGSKTKKLMEWV